MAGVRTVGDPTFRSTHSLVGDLSPDRLLAVGADLGHVREGQPLPSVRAMCGYAPTTTSLTVSPGLLSFFAGLSSHNGGQDGDTDWFLLIRQNVFY